MNWSLARRMGRRAARARRTPQRDFRAIISARHFESRRAPPSCRVTLRQPNAQRCCAHGYDSGRYPQDARCRFAGRVGVRIKPAASARRKLGHQGSSRTVRDNDLRQPFQEIAQRISRRHVCGPRGQCRRKSGAIATGSPKARLATSRLSTQDHVGGSKPPIWRRIQVADCTLDVLHQIVQTAMGWTNSHLHLFEDGEDRFSDPRFELDGD